MKYLFVILLHLSFSSVLLSQPNEHVERILGRWVWQSVDNPSESIYVEFVVKNDSLVLLKEDEYGNMEEGQKFHVTPIKSGRKGLLFERVTLGVDGDGDTTKNSTIMKISDLDKSIMTVVTCSIPWSIVNLWLDATPDPWKDKYSKKFKMIRDGKNKRRSQ